MTMTDTAPAPTAATEASDDRTTPVAGVYDWLTTSNHTTIGRLWILSAVPLLVATLAVGVIVGIERSDAAAVDLFGGTNEYFRYWSLFRFALPLLVVAPLFVGLATLIVPLQVGASNIAFPRAALASFWAWLCGAVIMVVSVIANGGWGALDGVDPGDEADAIALTLVGTGMVIVALLLASICIATTVVSLRTRGMNLLRVPTFSWSMLVTAGVWLLTLPVAIANLTLVYVDLRAAADGRDFIFGNPEQSQLPIWGQLDWVVGQPQVYAFAIPVLGIIGSVVPVSAGVRQVNHAVMISLIGLFGLLSVGGWSQPAFKDITEQFVFIVFGLVAVLPVLGVLGGAMATLVAGRDRIIGVPSTALVGVLAAILVLAGGVASGALRVIEPFELGSPGELIGGRSTIGGVFTFVMLAGVLGAVGGIWFWAPKITGTMLSEGLGRLAVLLVMLGAILAGAAEVAAGFMKADDFLVSEPSEDGVEVLSAVGTVGIALAALGALVVLVSLLRSRLPGSPAAGDDPWEGQTLEWATHSPPYRGTFEQPPPRVLSEAPLLDEPSTELEDA